MRRSCPCGVEGCDGYHPRVPAPSPPDNGAEIRVKVSTDKEVPRDSDSDAG